MPDHETDDLGDLTRAQIRTMSTQERDQLRRHIARRLNLCVRDVRVCQDCGRVCRLDDPRGPIQVLPARRIP